MGGTHIRVGDDRHALQAGASIADAAGLLAEVTRINVRGFRDDPVLRAEAIRRVMSPPCPTRCYVSDDGQHNDCNCPSGLQWTTDTEAQAMEGCPARDVWNDARALLSSHTAAGRGPGDPIASDCDCLTPFSLGVAAYLAWFAPQDFAVGGVQLGDARSGVKSAHRFAVGITLPAPEEGKERIGHAYGLVNYRPRSPQPLIKMPYEGGPWYVWDASAHWGMKRPEDSFYTNPRSEHVGFEVRRESLDGLKMR